MRKIIPLLVVVSILFFTENLIAQEELEFIETRQEMADSLTNIKDEVAVKTTNWVGAQDNFDEAKETWLSKVKPMIVEGRKKEVERQGEEPHGKYKEYFARISEVEGSFDDLAQLLKNKDLTTVKVGEKDVKKIDQKINAIIWGISHHPRGFDVPKPRYQWWDWVFGLGIGLGWCVFATFFGLYLRRSYYRRYGKQQI